jgi:hypothetical protein
VFSRVAVIKVAVWEHEGGGQCTQQSSHHSGVAAGSRGPPRYTSCLFLLQSSEHISGSCLRIALRTVGQTEPLCGLSVLSRTVRTGASGTVLHDAAQPLYLKCIADSKCFWGQDIIAAHCRSGDKT